MKFNRLALASLALVASSSFAAIAPFGAGDDSELFLAVQDPTGKVSFTFDLGVSLSSFLSVAQGAQAGYSRSWGTADANWASFQALVGANTLNWTVMAGDATGNPATTNLQRLLITAPKSVTEAKVEEVQRTPLVAGLGGTQGGRFFSSVNNSGTHAPQTAFEKHGSSVNALSDSGFGYFGEAGGTSATLNGNLKFNGSNVIGGVSNFWYLTTGASTGPSVATQFKNSQFVGEWTFDGSTLAYTLAPVPEPGTYALLLAGLGVVVAMSRRRYSA